MSEQPLKPKQQREMVERLAELARSGMPLPEGLRAAAEETKSRRLAGELRSLATQLESGAKWEERLVEENASGLPSHVLGVIRAGVRSGNLGDALDSLVDQDRAYRDVLRQLFSTLAYPAILLAATMVLLVSTLILIVRPMKEVFADFGTELPPATQLWITMADTVPSGLMGATILSSCLLLAIRLIGGRVGWARFVSGIPIFGSLVHMAGVSQMLRLLQIMLAHEMPLPEALRLTSAGASNANMRYVSDWLAKGSEAGVPLSELMASTPRVPASIVPIVRWGESNDAMGEAMRSAYELLEGRIRLRGSLLSVLVGPLMLVFVSISIGLLVVAMFMPLVSLIQNLM